MHLHRRLVDMRLERGVVVGQRAGPRRPFAAPSSSSERACKIAFSPHDTPFELSAAHREGGARRRGGPFAQADGARRARPPARHGTVELHARGLARARERGAGRARGDEPDRLPGAADAGAQPGRAVAAQRPLRHRRGLQAAGPPRRGDGAGADARGGRDLPRRQHRALLPPAALQPLPLPDQGARRGAAARRAAAHARVHHEGRLHLRPRRGGPGRALRALPRAPTTASSTASGSSGTGSSRTSG